MTDRVQPARRYGPVTPPASVSGELVAQGYAPTAAGARQLKVRAFSITLAIARSAVKTGHREVVVDLIAQLEAIAASDQQQFSLDGALEGEAAADGQEDAAVMRWIRAPSPETARAARSALAAVIVWSERLLAKIPRVPA